MNTTNPFGLSGGKPVSVYDLSEDERGARCTCTCPSCGALFQARMGDIREWHFAHRNGGCPEEQAYIAGLFMLLNEYLRDGGRLCLPPVYVYAPRFSHPDYLKNESWMRSNISVRPNPRAGDLQKVIAFGSKTLTFDDAQIVMDARGRAEALLCVKSGKSLAVRVVPPATSCRRVTGQPYQDIATLVLDLAPLHENKALSTDNIRNALSTSAALLSWVTNPAAITAVKPELEKVYREQHTISFTPLRRPNTRCGPMMPSPSLPHASAEDEMLSCIGCGVKKRRSEFPELSPAGARCIDCIRAAQAAAEEKSREIAAQIRVRNARCKEN